MDVIELGGSYFEMGRQYGRRLAASGSTAPPASAEKLAFARECATAVGEHAPELLEELEGVADGSGQALDQLSTFALTLGEGPACSVVAISGRHTVDGRPLFGRNFDFFDWDLPYQELYTTRPAELPGRWESLGCTDVLVGREDGVNAAGLAMAQTHVSGRTVRPGVLFSIAGRMILDRCATVGEAVDLLKALPHVRANNWLLADAADQIAVVETSPEQVTVTYANEGFAIATNHFRADATAHDEQVKDRPEDSETRLCALRDWWDQRSGPVSAAALRTVLASHGADGVCVHRSAGSQPLSTIRSLVTSPGSRRVDVAAGPPCRSGYRTYNF